MGREFGLGGWDYGLVGKGGVAWEKETGEGEEIVGATAKKTGEE